MSNDPFADDFDQNTDTKETSVDQTNIPTSAPTSTGTEVSVTMKGGTGFDAPWVVLRAPDVSTATALLDEDMQELLKAAAKYGKAFAALGGGGTSSGGSSGGRPAAGPTTHPTGRQEFCKHGEMEYKTGVSKAGKAYKVFSCPGPRDEQCKGVFDNG